MSADLRAEMPLYLPRLERIQSIRDGALRESGGDADADVGVSYSDLLDVLDAAEVAHKMREAIKEAHAALLQISECRVFCEDSMDIDSHATNASLAALAKLKPFTAAAEPAKTEGGAA